LNSQLLLLLLLLLPKTRFARLLLASLHYLTLLA
jgi:hypothetical protein